MTYLRRNLIPLIVGLIALVTIVAIAIAAVGLALSGGRGTMSDAQFERQMGPRADGGARHGSASLGVELGADLTVLGVVSGGPGEAAGLKAGDQLRAINGVEVKSVDEVRARLGAVPAETEYTVTVLREGRGIDLRARKGSMTGDLGGMFRRWADQARPFGRERSASPEGAPPPAPQGAVLGVSLQPVTGGLRVLAVAPGGAASVAGMQADDVIVSANGRATATVESLQAILREVPAGGTVAIAVKRGDQQVTLTATLGPRT